MKCENHPFFTVFYVYNFWIIILSSETTAYICKIVNIICQYIRDIDFKNKPAFDLAVKICSDFYFYRRKSWIGFILQANFESLKSIIMKL